METIEIHATKLQIEDFQSSVLWQDIVRELESWKHGFSMELGTIVDNAKDENPSTASVLLHMGDINGRQKAVDYVLTILDVFLQIIEDRKNDSNSPS